MAITNGNTWLADIVGDISGKIEEFCLDVEDVIYVDTVNYVESKLKKVSAEVRGFCLEFMQEVFTSSQEQASEEVLSNMPPLESSDSDTTSDTAKEDYLEEGSCSINNYSDVDSEICGDATQHVPISQAETMQLKSEDGHEYDSLTEGPEEHFNGSDTCTDSRSTVKSLYCVSPEEHESFIPDVASSDEFEEVIGSDCSAQESHSLNDLINIDENCITVDTGEICSGLIEITEQQPIQNEVLENMTSTMRNNYEFDESEWEII